MKTLPAVAVVGLCLASVLAAAPAPSSFDQQKRDFQRLAAAALIKPEGQTRTARDDQALLELAVIFDLPRGPEADLEAFERRVLAFALKVPGNDELARAADELIRTAKATREAEVARARAEQTSLLAEAARSCLAATIPADLDATLAALSAYANPSDRANAVEDYESWQRGNRAYRFVRRWQDYLAARERAGSAEGAVSILRELAESVDPAFMPRSAILQVISPPSPALAESLAGAISLLNSAAEARDLTAAVRSLPADFSFQSSQFPKVLAALLDERRQVEAGLRPASLHRSDDRLRLPLQDPAGTPDVLTALEGFRRHTRLLAVEGSFPRPLPFPPKREETPDAYLLRLADHFSGKQDWLRTREALEQYRRCFEGNAPAWLLADIEGFRAYLGALNLERAKQHASAIAAYRRALRSAGRYLPVSQIAKRLDALREQDPDAFRGMAAVDEDLGPPSQSLGEGAAAAGGSPNHPSLPRGPLHLRPAPTGPR